MARSCPAGFPPGGEADAPPAPDLTPGGALGDWSEGDFIGTLRTGTMPYGKALDDEFMPWKDIGLLTDDQLKAVWLYLSSLEARETTQ